MEEVTCDLGFEGLLSDSKGQGSTLRTESAGVMLGTKAVVTAARGQGRSDTEPLPFLTPPQSPCEPHFSFGGCSLPLPSEGNPETRN